MCQAREFGADVPRADRATEVAQAREDIAGPQCRSALVCELLDLCLDLVCGVLVERHFRLGTAPRCADRRCCRERL